MRSRGPDGALRHPRRPGMWRGLALALLAVSACRPSGEDPFAVFQHLVVGGTDAVLDDAPTGYVAIVFLNHSEYLVQTVVALTYPEQPPLVWVTPVTPASWDSLVVECGLSQVAISGAIPVDLVTSTAGAEVPYSGPPLIVGEDIVCGSTIVLEITANPDTAAAVPIALAVHTIPNAPSRPTSYPHTSPTAPGPEAGLVLVSPETVTGVATDVTASWESGSGLIYVMRWQLAGTAPRMAALLECPAARVAWGVLSDPNASGATVGPDDVALPAPPPLAAGTDFQCGDAIVLRATGDAGRLESIALSAEARGAGAALRVGQVDLFGNIRRLLDETGFAGRLSNANALAPAPSVTD